MFICFIVAIEKMDHLMIWLVLEVIIVGDLLEKFRRVNGWVSLIIQMQQNFLSFTKCNETTLVLFYLFFWLEPFIHFFLGSISQNQKQNTIDSHKKTLIQHLNKGHR